MQMFLGAKVPYQAPVAKKKKFSYEEDQRLLCLVNEYGAKKWRRIAEMMPGRTAKQCRDRYCDYLNPEYFNGQWTKEEDEILCQKYKELGPRWTQIALFLRNRSANSIRNRWSYGVSKQMWDEPEPEPDPMKVVLPPIDEIINKAGCL